MIQLLKELEEQLKLLKRIGSKDTIHLELHPNGEGFVITRSIIAGKIKTQVIMDFDNLAAFILKTEEILEKEIKWRDQ